MKSGRISSAKKCPACSLINPSEALRCDCGYDFPSGQIEQSYINSQGHHEEIKKGLSQKLNIEIAK